MEEISVTNVMFKCDKKDPPILFLFFCFFSGFQSFLTCLQMVLKILMSLLQDRNGKYCQLSANIHHTVTEK